MPTETENQRRITRVKCPKALNKIDVSPAYNIILTFTGLDARHARVIIAFLRYNARVRSFNKHITKHYIN